MPIATAISSFNFVSIAPGAVAALDRDAKLVVTGAGLLREGTPEAMASLAIWAKFCSSTSPGSVSVLPAACGDGALDADPGKGQRRRPRQRTLSGSFQYRTGISADLLVDGEVDWRFQRQQAENAVRDLTGVVGINSLIRVNARPQVHEVKQKIEGALRRSAELDASHVTVRTEGGRVILGGKVHDLVRARSR